MSRSSTNAIAGVAAGCGVAVLVLMAIAARFYVVYRKRNRRSIIWSSFTKAKPRSPSRSPSYGIERPPDRQHSTNSANAERSASGAQSPPPAVAKTGSKSGLPETSNAQVSAYV
jgi:hypothetical protein